MNNRPNEYLNWTTGPSSTNIAPPSNLRTNGWGVGIAPPAPYTNYQLWLLDQWVQYLDGITNTGTPNQVIRLIGGGQWSFLKSTGALSWSANANLSIAGISDSNNIIPAGTVNLNEGDVAYVEVNAPLIILGDIQNGSDIVSNVNFTANLEPGMDFSGAGIPSGTTIFAVGDSTLTLSANATATATQQQLIAAASGNLTVVVTPAEDFIPNLTSILIAERFGDEVYVGVNSTQMILRDHEYKPFMGTGYVDTYILNAGENLTAGQNVYISPGPTDDSGRTLGAIYKLDVSAANQLVRGVYAGTVISDVTTGNPITVVYNGFYAYTSLVAGKNYWADPANPGGITIVKPQDAGSKRVAIGFAVSTTSLIITGTGAVDNDTAQVAMKSELIGTGDGVTTVFSLSTFPLNAESLFIFVNGGIAQSDEYTLSGKDITFPTAPGEAQTVYSQYILAGQNYIQGFQEVPALISGSTYSIAGQPTNKDALFFFVDGTLLEKSEYSLTMSSTLTEITLNDSLGPAQTPYCFYLSPVGFGTTPTAPGITAISNEGTGHGIFDSVAAGVAKLKSLIPGAGISMTDTSTGIIVSAPGTTGGYNIYGTKAAPIIVTGVITPNADQRQIIYVKSTLGAGNINCTIANGTVFGQELSVRGAHASDTVTILGTGSNTDQEGDCLVDNRQCINYFWNNLIWDEMSRRR